MAMTIVACGDAAQTTDDMTHAGNEDEAGQNTAEENAADTDATNDADTTDTSATDAGSDTTEDTNDETTEQDPLAQAVVGFYAVRIQITTEQTLPIIGASRSATIAYSLGEVRKENGGFMIYEKSCKYAMLGGGVISAIIPDAVPNSVPQQATSISFVMDGDTVNFDREQSITILGANLNDIENEALPSDMDDTRLWDQDNDGQPGVTAFVEGLLEGEVYFVQRQRLSYSGSRGANGQFDGRVNDSSEQNIIGSTNALFEQDFDTTSIPEENLVSLLPLENIESCSALVEQIPTLFPDDQEEE